MFYLKLTLQPRFLQTYQVKGPVTLLWPLFQLTYGPPPELILRPNITLFELTVPFNSPEALSAARSSLKSSYLQLITDLEDRGWSVSYFTLEIGSLGHFDQAAIRTLSDAFHFSKNEAKQVLKSLSKIVVSCSYHIFNATSWDTNKPFCC